jgi:hypothetical protein
MTALRMRKGMTRRLPVHVYQTWNLAGWERLLVRVPLASARPVERSNVAAPSRPVHGSAGVDVCACDHMAPPTPAIATATTAPSSATSGDHRPQVPPRYSVAFVPTSRLYGCRRAEASPDDSPGSQPRSHGGWYGSSGSTRELATPGDTRSGWWERYWRLLRIRRASVRLARRSDDHGAVRPCDVSEFRFRLKDG